MEKQLREILNITNEIAKTNSKTEKQNILKQNSDNKLLKDILQFVYNPFITTGISTKKISKKINIKTIAKEMYIFISDLNTLMNYLRENNTGKDLDIYLVQEFMNKFDDEEIQKLISDIASKNLKIGATSGTCNKVFGEDFIPKFDIMLAEKYSKYMDKIKDDEVFIVTTKIDGNRGMIIKEYNQIQVFSRTGKLIDGLDDIINDLQNIPNNICIDGEIVAINTNNLNSADLYSETATKTRAKGKKEGLEFLAFDILPLADFKKGICETPCIDRKENLVNILKEHDYKHIKALPILYIGTDKSKVLELLAIATENGEEGLMVNIASAPYECKRTKSILKVKKFHDADVLVVDVIEGTGENIGKLGAITIEFIHDKKHYQCNCGSGFSAEERVDYWENPDKILDKIVTIRYFEISKNKKGTFSLRFPTWEGRIRDDKTEISMY